MNWNGIELPDSPYYQDDAVIIYHSDCRDILPLIPDKSIDLVLTDPPYGIDYQSNRRRFTFDKMIGDIQNETADWLGKILGLNVVVLYLFCNFSVGYNYINNPYNINQIIVRVNICYVV